MLSLINDNNVDTNGEQIDNDERGRMEDAVKQSAKSRRKFGDEI